MRMFLWVKCRGISDVHLMFDMNHDQFVLFGGLLIDTQSGVLFSSENASIHLLCWITLPLRLDSWHEMPA